MLYLVPYYSSLMDSCFCFCITVPDQETGRGRHDLRADPDGVRRGAALGRRPLRPPRGPLQRPDGPARRLLLGGRLLPRHRIRALAADALPLQDVLRPHARHAG